MCVQGASFTCPVRTFIKDIKGGVSVSALSVSSESFVSEVLTQEGVVLVDFWAAWCGPCKKLNPILEELEESFNGRVKFCKVDVMDNVKLAGDYAVSALPTMIVFKTGLPQAQINGLVSKQRIKKVLYDALESSGAV